MELIESFKPGEFVLAKFLLGLFNFVGLVENIVVTVAILTNYILWDIPSNWFVLSLAIVYTLFCVYAGVIFIHFQPTKHLPSLMKSVWFIEPLARVSYLSSSSSLFIVMFNRFLSIYDSLKYPSRITLERAKRLIIIVWSVAIFMTILTDIWSPIDFLSFICFTLSSLSTIVLNIYLFNKASNQRKTIKRQHVTVITGQKRSMMSEYRSFFRLAMVTFTSGVAYAFTIVFGIFRYKRFRQRFSFVSTDGSCKFYCVHNEFCLWSTCLLYHFSRIQENLQQIQNSLFRTIQSG